LKLTKKTCPVCNCNKLETVAKLTKNSKKRFKKFSEIKYAGLIEKFLNEDDIEIVKCQYCTHFFYLNQPLDADLIKMYNFARPLIPEINSSSIPYKNMLGEMKRLYLLLGIKAPAMLDYGAGSGRWAKAAIDAGFRVFAFEPSKIRSANFLNGYVLFHNLNFIKGKKFDVINFEQVLEHVPSPLFTLMNIKKYCKIDTIVRISVPNLTRSPEGAMIWNEWPYNGTRVHTMAPFEHLHGFTPRSLRTLILKAGFTPASGLRLYLFFPLDQIRKFAYKIYPNIGSTKEFVVRQHRKLDSI
jgi:SAM-dependent methyltransferase